MGKYENQSQTNSRLNLDFLFYLFCDIGPHFLHLVNGDITKLPYKLQDYCEDKIKGLLKTLPSQPSLQVFGTSVDV